MAMEVESRSLRFNLEKELDRKAWDTLQAVPAGQRNMFILNAISAYGDQQTEEERQERFARRVAEIVVDMLSDASIPVSGAGAERKKGTDADVFEKSMAMADDFLSHWG